jgi:hypothetical protein
MIYFLVVSFVFSSFTEKWYLSVGCAHGTSGKILVSDTDRDGYYELFISDYYGPDYINICELYPPNTWQYDSFTNTGEQNAWNIGDFDCDGLWDLLQWGNVAQGTPPTIFFVTESPDSYSYPVNEVWRDTVGPATFIADEAFDIDQDGYPELVKNRPEPYGEIGIYECISNNHYDLIHSDTTSYGAPLATHAFGDFDQDGHNEVVFAGADETYWIYESPANNTYERIRFDTLPTHNIRDCFEIPDMDGDGKWEFVLKGSWVSGTIDAFIFEATGNNAYDTIKVFHFPGGDYYGGHSDAGDVDGDSIPEIVLEARQSVYIIKAASNDSFYVWETLPGNAAGFNIKIFDLDNNGLNDIIMSSAQQTWIYEYESGGVEEQDTGMLPTSLSVQPNPFRRQITIHYALSTKYKDAVLRIFDAVGRLVKSFSLPSAYTIVPSVITWNGDDDVGRRVPAGVYFVQLEGDGKNLTEKTILLR